MVAIIGQGYVGLPLAIKLSESGMNVIGLDTNLEVVNAIAHGNSLIEDVSSESLKKVLESGKYKISSEYEEIRSSTIKCICVPTPLKNHKPDLSFLIEAVEKVGENLVAGDLVVIESTIEPGTTREVLVPILEKKSKLIMGEFYVAYSPERIDPNNKDWTITNTPKLVSGYDYKSQKLAREFYSNFIDVVVDCKSLEIAETAKLLENSFRYINISFVNELSIFCNRYNIDINQVIEAANTKPYGFMPFYPSLGVGGHCIPVDPLYLANTARKIGAPIKMIELADKINQELPEYFVGRADEKLNGLKGKKIIIVGVSYKPNIADVRESPVKKLIAGLKQRKALVSWHDDLVKDWNGEKSVALSSDFDLAIIATPHDYLDLSKLGNVPVLNTRGST